LTNNSPREDSQWKLTPKALGYARDHKLSDEQISSIIPTGRNETVSLIDVRKYCEKNGIKLTNPEKENGDLGVDTDRTPEMLSDGMGEYLESLKSDFGGPEAADSTPEPSDSNGKRSDGKSGEEDDPPRDNETNSATPTMVLIGVGGTGAASLSLASEHDLSLDVQFRNDQHSFLGDRLFTIAYDLSTEYSDRIQKSGSNKIKRSFPMTYGNGAGRVPPVAEVVANRAFNSLKTFFVDLNPQQLITLVHSMGGGAGSGTAPKFADELRNNNIGSNIFSIGVVDVFQDALEKLNHMYNLPLVTNRFDLAIQIENRAAMGAENSSRRSASKSYYRTHIKKVPGWFSQNSLQLWSVTDRYAARIWRLLYGSTQNNTDNIVNKLTQASDSYRDGVSRFAIPYIWPIDRDVERDFRLVKPQTMVTRAMMDGALTRVRHTDFQSAKSAILIYRSPSEEGDGGEESMAQAVADHLGLARSKVIVHRSTLAEEDVVDAYEILVLAVGQIPEYVRELREEVAQGHELHHLAKNAGAKWANLETKEAGAENVKSRWEKLENEMFNFFQSGLSEKEIKALPEELRTELEDLRNKLDDMDVLQDFIGFCDANGVRL
jgi:hypothetical protein